MPPPRGLVQRLDQLWHRRPILPRGAVVLVACSGGADSVALLRLLAAVNRSNYWGWRLVIGHVDHALRADSAGDAAFVAGLGVNLDLPVATVRLATPPRSEAAARDARYAALARIAEQHECSHIALGHHADDQVETVLLNLLRGTGLRGLGGMARRRRSGAHVVVRPLLDVQRAELRRFLQQVDQSWREDESNTAIRFLRNRVRHELLPLLESMQPRVRGSISGVATHARAALRTCRKAAAQSTNAASSESLPLTWPRAVLELLDATTLVEMWTAALDIANVPVGQLGRKHWNAIIDALRVPRHPCRIDLPDGLLMRLNSRTLSFHHAADADEQCPVTPLERGA
jgi:tRNA(Ile)-lysidine synthetase-like protein